MDNSFRPTILHRPRGEDDERDRGGDRDRETARERDRDYGRDRERDRYYRDYERDREREREQDAEWDRERDRGLDRDAFHSQTHHQQHDRRGPGYVNYDSQHRHHSRGSSRDMDSRDAHRHTIFALRSPTMTHPPPPFTSPSTNSHAQPPQHSPPRPNLPNPYSISPSSSSASAHLPPSGPPSTALPPGTSSHHPGPSPLHPPRGYYPPPPPSQHHSLSTSSPRLQPPSGPDSSTQEASNLPSGGSFYDPLTDTTRVAPATTPKSRDPFSFSRPEEHRSYHNGTYTSPNRSHERPRSPPLHPHPNHSADTRSIPGRPSHAISPTPKHVAPDKMNSQTNGDSSVAPLIKTEVVAASPLQPIASIANTPSRSADPMSFSNILSSAEPAPKSKPAPGSPKPLKLSPELEQAEPIKLAQMVSTPDPDNDTEIEKDFETEPEPFSKPTPTRELKKKTSRKSKGRASELRESSGPKERKAPIKKELPAPVTPAKRQANGEPKKKTWSMEMERKIQKAEHQLEMDASKLDLGEFDQQEFKSRSRKRHKVLEEKDLERVRLRRASFSLEISRKLHIHTELGKRRYDDTFYEDALHEVREQEVYAEKERKKDMQRKRRREKSMAVTMEQREAALTKANEAEDEEERQKYLKEAERAGKKAQQTKLILQKGIKGPARKIDLQPELGNVSSAAGSDAEGGVATSKKSKARGNNRPKKSKEQKQAEKDSAEAAQAALDAGEELPAKDEGKVRIKIKKSKDKDKDKNKDKETELIADLAENKADDVKDKVEEVLDLEKRFASKGYNQIYDQIWRDMARKDVNKTYRLATDSYNTKGSNLKKTAILASKEAKRWQLRTNKGTKDLQARAKRVMRDMMGFWKRNEREERDLRKAAEKQEIENARKEEADREAARQKRKLNFLISQTELYSHFIGKKIKTDEVERSTDNPEIAKDPKQIQEAKLSVQEPTGPLTSKVTDFENLDFDDEDESNLQAAAMANAQNAIAEAQKKARDFNNQGLDMDDEGEMNFQNPTGLGDVEIEQPKLLNAQLKEYQLKGLNWLVNLYEQGINGILADEMGLGKTVQSISVMAYLAEKHDIWGPFLVVAPASTLHNWQQEIAKFVPEFKILPYWGSAADRKVLRKFWDRKHTTYRKDAAFHVCVTSYQLVVSDNAYFQKMRWQYMILDEAQAIKSSQSSRWKSLLGFHCRNRLLLTGTPIQNNMQELWALLHFIMPSLFDSHDEFSEWFSKDIESHAQSNTKLNEDQLKRLHMILKPFMLRRVKKHVQKELGDKIELDVFCNLTYRQRAYYGNLRNQINIMDLVEKATIGDDQDSGTLMNLVMQFRKVCNHPDLFERAEVSSPFACTYFAETASFAREGNNVPVGYSTRSLIEYELPSLVWTEGGRLNQPGKDNTKAGWRNKALRHMMNIWSPEHVREQADGQKGFSWLRFSDAAPADVYKATHSSVFSRAVDELQKQDRLGHMNVIYDEVEDEKYTPTHALFQIRDRKNRKPLADVTRDGVLSNLMNVARTKFSTGGLNRLEQAGRPNASAPPVEVTCTSRNAVIERENVMFNVPIRRALYGPALSEVLALVEKRVPLNLFPVQPTLPKPDNDTKRFTNIAVPSMRRFVTDSGKLAKLDELLLKLKNEGHRVLLYFQMTRMIDLMEEYLTYRNFKYCRLDGSTKLEDRRDTVHDFQTRPDIFIFLLSTRAGGLGINLTSADTVIFYDSDWNPTIDSQAMDRAHRLGQTRQVTVYRLITRGTIEERIRKRALQKEEVQRVVIQGGGASVDFSGRRAPENRNRDIAMWLADDEQAEMIERREKELLESGEMEKQKKKGGKKKRPDASTSLDDMYHEGEGNFDDGNKAGPSGTATPADSDAKGPKKRGPKGSKRAKTTKQRLAIADGMVDV